MLKALQYIQKYRMIEEKDCIIVGVSGGADSVCLLFVLHDLQKTLPFRLVAVHVEHGVRREESLRDARFVEELCRELCIPCSVYHRDVPGLAAEQRISVEEAGRNVRYDCFRDALKKYAGTKIAVAHNQNDQAETVLWNLIRGTGLKGLGGILPVRERIIRPLLGCSREEIEAYLEERGSSFRTDQTNLSDDYTRNRLRLHVLPYFEKELNAGASEHIAKTGSHLQKVEAFLVELTKEASTKCILILEPQGCQEGRPCDFRLLADKTMEQPEIIREYLLRYCLELAGVGLRDLGSVHMEALEKLLTGQSGREIHLPGRYLAIRSQNEIRFQKKEAFSEPIRPEPVYMEHLPGTYEWKGKIFSFSLEPYRSQNIQEKKYTKWLDYDKITHMICLRGRQSGDYFVLNQEGDRKKLKSYLIESKIPEEQRDEIPILAEGSHVLWVTGYRISAAFKITEHTKKVLKIQLMEDE